MKLAIVGSRTFTNYAYLEEAIYTLVMSSGFVITEIVSGGARGADSLAETFAHNKGLPLTVFPADWETHGKSAGYKRNAQIIQHCSLVTAFWDGVSRGTKHSIDLAVKHNKPVFIYKDWKGNE